jgi:hypothetical protein
MLAKLRKALVGTLKMLAMLRVAPVSSLEMLVILVMIARKA